ncbi:MAG TPA: ATP-binding protein [Tepidisphaeraceae bacterium]|nr:ATP-binding protein [Tepidisphaeraceae bacterium]
MQRPSLKERLRRLIAQKTERPPESDDLRREREARRRIDALALRRASGIEQEKMFREAELRHLDIRLPAEFRALAARLHSLLDQPELIAIAGDRGRGKTWLGCGLINAFCDALRPAIYRRTARFFEELSTADWSDKEWVRRNYVTPELLVLDEVQVRDADRVWQDNELTTLIDRRYARCSATLLLSNFTPEMLANNLGESIQRRLSESGGTWPTPWPRIKEILT